MIIKEKISVMISVDRWLNSYKKNRDLCKIFLLTFLITFSVAPAFAHKVTIFAWVEGNTIYTQSKFSRGKKARGALVTVFDMEGNRLLEGTTDEKGEFSFKIPKKTGLKVVLKASMGHLAEWKIPVEEIAAAQSSQNKTPEAGVITDTTSLSNRAPTFGLAGVALYFANRRKTQEVRGQRSEVKK